MQAVAAQRAGRCLSDAYVGCSSPLEWECAKGHRWRATPGAVKHRTWCPECARLARAHTIEEMREVARQRGGQCLSETYRNAATPLEWHCARGHTWRATSNRILQGGWCKQCYYDSMRGTLESMQALAKSRGGRCLSERYVDAGKHLSWECDKGHTWRAVPYSIAEGRWCPQCAILRRCQNDEARSRYLAVRIRGGSST